MLLGIFIDQFGQTKSVKIDYETTREEAMDRAIGKGKMKIDKVMENLKSKDKKVDAKEMKMEKKCDMKMKKKK